MILLGHNIGLYRSSEARYFGYGILAGTLASAIRKKPLSRGSDTSRTQIMTMAKKQKKNQIGKSTESTSEKDEADRLEKELNDLIAINETRSGAFSKIMKAIEKGNEKPNNH